MTEEQFDIYIQTDMGQSDYYEYLFNYHPELGKEGLFHACENCDYMDEFMDHIGVV